MRTRLNFSDTVTLYPVTPSDYGKDVLGKGVTVEALYEQVTGFSHSNYQDATTASSRLYLPPDNSFILDNFYRLEGMVVKVNPFSGEDSKQYFRITSVTVGRDMLIDNQVRHIECELTKTSDFDNEA